MENFRDLARNDALVVDIFAVNLDGLTLQIAFVLFQER